MDVNAPLNQADRRSPPREAAGPSPSAKREELAPAHRIGEILREPDETTLGPWLQGFFLQSPPPDALSLSPGGHADPRGSPVPLRPTLSADTTLAFDLADAIDDAWPRPADRRFDITRAEQDDHPPESDHPAVPPLSRRIRRLLRNRVHAADLACIIAMVVLLLAGAGLILATVLRYVTHISPSGTARAPWQVPLLLAANALIWIVGLSVPSLVMIKLIADLPWFRVGFYFSIIWFLAGLALFL